MTPAAGDGAGMPRAGLAAILLALGPLLAGTAAAQGAAVAAAAAAEPAAARPAAVCPPDPLRGRALYLRGSFNGWTANEGQRLRWACGRWVGVATLEGDHRFKVGDEAWSADADLGAAPASAPVATSAPAVKDTASGLIPLAPRGADIRHRFGGVHRVTLTMPTDRPPALAIESCPDAPPLGPTVLFLRGTMNNWAALDDFAFQWSCDAYYLNTRLTGRHEFKLADAAWTSSASFGREGGNFVLDFAGEQTLRVVFAAGRPQLTLGPLSFADPTARPVDDPVARSLRFHSRQAVHKRPFGPVTPVIEVEFAAEALPGVERIELVVERRRLEGNQDLLEYAEVARLPLRREGAVADGHERHVGRHRFDAMGVYGYWFDVRIGGRHYALHNNGDSVPWTREKGSGGRAEVVERPPETRLVRRFRQTVHAADLKLPAWASDIVYYQIFPDRFRNGDPSNDPRPGRQRYRDGTVERHADWNERPYKPGSGDGSDGLYNNDFFGGDLAGITEKLDELAALGVNTLYLTPIFEAASNHKYDTADWHRIDPGFGSDADFDRLVAQARSRGLRVVLDTSLNHVGADSVYFDRFGRRGSPGRGAFSGARIQPDSPFARWFRFDPSATEPDRQYRGWVDFPDLPELDKADPGYRAFAYGDADSVTRRWLRRGIGGWRMDVAPWVPDDFWRGWRRAVKDTDPEAITVSEAWFEASKYLLGDMFDSTMNYVFRNATLDFAGGGRARDLAEILELLREATPAPVLHAQMNLLSSHDVPRAMHVLGARDGADGAAATRARQRLLLATLLQMAYPGAPSIYYGDEVGVRGGDDPYNRATYPWPDLGGRPDLALRESFRGLVAMRRAHEVLRRGSIDAPLHVDDHVLAFPRRLGGQWALVLLNNAEAPREMVLDLPPGAPAAWRDVTPPVSGTGAVVPTLRAEQGVLRLTLPPLFGRVLVSD